MSFSLYRDMQTSTGNTPDDEPPIIPEPPGTPQRFLCVIADVDVILAHRGQAIAVEIEEFGADLEMLLDCRKIQKQPGFHIWEGTIHTESEASGDFNVVYCGEFRPATRKDFEEFGLPLPID